MGDWIEDGQKMSIEIVPANDLARTGFKSGPTLLVSPLVVPGFTGMSVSVGCLSDSAEDDAAEFELRVVDSNGTADHGVDTARLKFAIKLDSTFQDANGNVYHYRKPGGKAWLFESVGGTYPDMASAKAACPPDWTLPTSANQIALFNRISS